MESKKITIAAITRTGTEYAYNAATAHKISKSSGQKIVKALNENKFRLNGSQVWKAYEIDQYDAAYDYAMIQSFQIRNGYLCEGRR